MNLAAFFLGYILGLALNWQSARLPPPARPGVRMRTVLAAILLSAISASAAPPAPDPAASQPFPPKQIGHFTLSGPVCKNGVLGVHIVASDAAEGNVYFNLKAICGHGDDDTPEPQSGKPLPDGVTRL